MSERLVPLGKRTEPVRPAPRPETSPRVTVYVETYGCQMNVADSDLIGSVLADAGYAVAARADEADVIVVNTCAVREKAEERVIARAGELGAVKRRRPGTVLAIAGPDSYRRLPDLLARSRAQLRPAAPAAAPAVMIDIKLDRAETYEGLSGA